MVLAELPPSLQSSSQSLSVEDCNVADAISAWLVALNHAEPNQTFLEATNQCVSLCQLFHSFAPEYLSERDFFTNSVTSANVTRQRRYNTRRLARSLANYFQINIRTSSPNSQKQRSPAPTLAPGPNDIVRAIAEGNQSDDAESLPLILSLAEVLLCAAVHSEKREAFIKTVLKLSSEHQDALAQSIRRTITEEKKMSVLSPISTNNENITIAHVQALSGKAQASSGNTLSVPQGIPLADYKALAAERDTLRKKLVASEFEKNKAVQVTDSLRTGLEESADKIRKLEASQHQQDGELQARTNALNDARTALRDAQLNTEELDVLRAKAASTEQLEASLKRASKRLEEVSDMRKTAKDLEAQISAFRENEERMGKHAGYLETQLSNSTERCKQLASLSDSLSSDLETRERQIGTLNNDNVELKTQLETANQQLTSMLVQSTHTVTQSKEATMSMQPEESPAEVTAEQRSRKEGPLENLTERKTSVQLIEQSDAAQEIMPADEMKELVSEQLFEETGFRLRWVDIVECVKGVMDAMQEMGEMQAVHQEEPVRDALGQIVPQNDSESQLSSEYSEQSGPDSSGIDAHTARPDVGSDSEGRMSLLQEFAEIDTRMAASRGDGDEFDFAANHVNVKEIHFENSTDDKGSPQLAGIPENREVFEADLQESQEETLFSSSYGSSVLNVQSTARSSPTSAELRIISGNNVTDTIIEQKSSGSCFKPGMHSPTDSPYMSYEIVEAKRKPSPVPIMTAKSRKCRSLTQNLRRAASMTVNLRSGFSRTHSQSETTRSLVRQARTELAALQNTIELMRVERQSSSSLRSLVAQLDTARHDLSMCQAKLRESETRCNAYHVELSDLIREVDNLNLQKEDDDDRNIKLLEEKERMLEHLMTTLKAKEEELKASREDHRRCREEMDRLRDSEKALEEKLRAASVIESAHEVEIARLTTRIDATDSIATRLTAVVKQTDGLHHQMSHDKEARLTEIAASAKREKELAEEARDEVKRVAKKQVSVLEDVRTAATMAARERGSRPDDMAGRLQTRRSLRFSEFWRRLLHREKVNIDYSMPGPSGSPNNKQSHTFTRSKSS